MRPRGALSTTEAPAPRRAPRASNGPSEAAPTRARAGGEAQRVRRAFDVESGGGGTARDRGRRPGSGAPPTQAGPGVPLNRPPAPTLGPGGTHPAARLPSPRSSSQPGSTPRHRPPHHLDAGEVAALGRPRLQRLPEWRPLHRRAADPPAHQPPAVELFPPRPLVILPTGSPTPPLVPQILVHPQQPLYQPRISCQSMSSVTASTRSGVMGSESFS